MLLEDFKRISPSPSHDARLSFDRDRFIASYNREPFMLTHRLSGHPLLDLKALYALAERTQPRGRVRHWDGRIPVDSDFDYAWKDHPTGATLEETFAHLDRLGAFVVIEYPEQDAEYASLIRALFEEIFSLSDELDPGVTEVMAYFFISSPGSVTPYHMDREMNFLLQIQGEKLVHLWDPRDRTIMTEEQVETLFARPDDRRPRYRDDFQPKARVVNLVPGAGVHHPFLAPHWVKNGSAVSVSLALTYRTRGSERIARAHRLNHTLRRIGFQPRSVGRSSVRDALKAEVFRRAQPIGDALRPVYRLGRSLLER